jgi:redox-sensitive bicupin YhaK (pirin superfamily)
MKTRTVSHLLYAQMVDMGGLPVRQPLPTERVEQADPFILLHHADIKVPTKIKPDHAGVGPHPHRGFSPVTFIFKGGVHHRDSRGNDSTIYAGGAQWMNAGRGILHSERPPHDIHDHGGGQEIIQVWINSPAVHKMDQPSYHPVDAGNVPGMVSADGLAQVNVFAGTVLGVKGPIPTIQEVNAATITFRKGARLEVPTPANHQVLLYLLDGKLSIDEYGIVDGLNLIKFNSDGEGFGVKAEEDTRALLLTGVPLNEEVVSYGPFVMNNQTEILEAMRDYQMGKMGVLIEE